MTQELINPSPVGIVAPHIFELNGQKRFMYADSDKHLAVCSAVTIQQMMIYNVRITTEHNTSPTETLSSLVEKMESLDYYKFWTFGTEEELNQLSATFSKDPVLSRYTWYDEDMIAANTKSNHVAYNLNRPIRDVDVVVRIYVLNQRSRVEIFKPLGIPDYTGTVLDSLL